MSEWIVYSKDGKTERCRLKSLEYSGVWMGECSVSVTVSSPVPIVFEIGDYLYYRGERFEINYDPAVIKSSEYGMAGDGFSYENVKFNSLSDELTRCDFLDYVPNDNEIHYSALPTFSFFADSIERLAERIQVNLDRIYTGEKKWTVSVHPEFVSVSNVNISVNNITCWDALALVKSQFNANFIIRNRTITIGTEGLVVGSLFSYGKGNGLITIERNAESDQKIITRLRAYGSTRNMPSRYYSQTSEDAVPNNMAVQHLMLPSFPAETLDPYIDSKNIEALGVREGTVFFDGSGDLEEIYPSLEGMTAEELKAAGVETSATGALDEIVSAEQITDDGILEGVDNIPPFTMVVKDLGFDLNDYLGTESAVISMKDGMCGGRDFEIVSCEKQSDGSYLLTCNRSEDTGLGLYFPYSGFQITGGDKFVLLNIEMPDAYIKAASQRLLNAATEYLSKNDYVRYSYTPKVDNIFMARQHDEAIANGLKSIYLNIKEGDLLMFEDNDLSISGNIVIDTLSIKEGESLIPEYEITLRNDKAVGSLEKIQNQIDSIVSGKTPIANGGGGGGYTAAQIKSLIEAVGDKLFLSKMKDDETPHNLGVGKDLSVGGDATIEGTAKSSEIIAKDSAHSEEFVSGFTGGKGWAIRFKEFLNAAGITEKKAVAEFDDVIVRGALRVYEFIVSQMLGENDNRIFTGMMEVDHYDAADGKVYLKTNNGKLYNPFRVDDVIIVQQYGGMPTEDSGYYVTKQYEFIVTGVGIGNTEDGEDRLDWLTFRNFTTAMEGGDLSLIAERDTLVRIDNLSDARRKGIIQIMSVGEDTPYMDFIYGAKTDPDNALKGRFGNIGGIYNPLFGWLKEFGAYLTNLYAVGEFRIAHTGEDVADAIEIAKGQFRTNYKQTTFDMTEEDNFFTNAAMTNNCEHWVMGEESTSYFLVDDLPQFFNYELYGSEDSFAGIAEHNGRDMLRLSASTILQENELIDKPGTHKVHTGTTENADGTYSKVFEEVPDTLYLSVRVYCVSSGLVELGFTDANGAFYNNDFHVSRELTAQEDAYTIKVSSTWDGLGDFCIKSSGDVYIDLLSLTDKPLESFMITTSTSIEQTAEAISMLGYKMNGPEGTVTNLKLQVNAMAGTISSTVGEVNKINNTITTSGWINAADSVRIFSEQVTAQGIAKTAEIKVYVDNAISKIRISADQIDMTANDFINIINQGTTTINASRINLNGVVTANNSFKIDTSGYMTCTGGTIAGFNITSYTLKGGNNFKMTLNVEDEGYPSIKWTASDVIYSHLGMSIVNEKYSGVLGLNAVNGYKTVLKPGELTMQGNYTAEITLWNILGDVGFGGLKVGALSGTSYFGVDNYGYIVIKGAHWRTNSSSVDVGEVYLDGTTLRVRTS